MLGRHAVSSSQPSRRQEILTRSRELLKGIPENPQVGVVSTNSRASSTATETATVVVVVVVVVTVTVTSGVDVIG